MSRKHRLAFVCGGGGARGALQVGALRALVERGWQPDFLVGTSIGAVNAAFFALDPTLARIKALEQAWREAAHYNFFSADWMVVATRALLNRAGIRPNPRLREFFVAHMPSPDLRFAQMRVPVYLVAADLNHARAVIYGEQPDQSVLEGLLASTALPPWVHPLEMGDLFLIDGGAVSNLPIEPAIAHGATEIVALDLSEPAEVDIKAHGFGPFASKLLNTIARRQIELELRLAAAHQVPVHLLKLRFDPPVRFWDFSHPDELFEQGYAIARRYLDELPRATPWGETLRAWWQAKRPFSFSARLR
jgi:NTE family protein